MADLTTLADAKAWLGIPTASVADDAILTRLITAVSAYIQTWLDRDLSSTTYTETLNGTGHRQMAMTNTPITAITSLVLSGTAIAAALPMSPTNPAPTGYAFDDLFVYILGVTSATGWAGILDRFPVGSRNVAITYTAGYAVIPPEISQAAIELTALRYKERDRIGQSSQSMAGETTAYITRDMPASVATILQNYKKVVPV